MGMGTKRTPATRARARERFLKALAAGSSVTAACRAGRVARSQAYRWREDDEAFADAWDVAVEAGTDELEDEALRRAKTGTLRPVFYEGSKCGSIREFSDTLAIFLLKARRPEKFKDRQVVEHDVTDRLAERVEAANKRVLAGLKKSASA